MSDERCGCLTSVLALAVLVSVDPQDLSVCLSFPRSRNERLLASFK